MKKLSYVSALVVCLFLVSITANATGLRNEFKEFEISPVTDLYLSKNVQKIWTVSYSAEESPVTVVKRKTLEGTEYVVCSKFFSVSYACTSTGFGAKETRCSWTKVPRKISKAVICRKELKRQQIITPNAVGDELALGLIASYLPDLINDGYTHLLN